MMASSSSSSSSSSLTSKYHSYGLWAFDLSISLLDDEERMSMDNSRSINVFNHLEDSDRIFKNICTLTEQDAINDLRLLLANLSRNKPNVLKDIIHNSNSYTDYGQSPLHIAVSKGSMQIVEMLLQRGASVNSIELMTQCTPLHTAAINSFTKCIPTLIVFGADVTAQSATGRCPLHYAAANGDIDTIKELLKGLSLTNLRNDNSNVNKFECSLHVKDLDGHTPLHLSIIDGNLKCIQYLVQLGSDVHCKDNDGRNALEICNQMGQSGTVITLLDNAMKNTLQNNPPIDVIETRSITSNNENNNTIIRLLPDEEYWVVIRETNMMQDDDGNVIVHKSKELAAVWAIKSRRYLEENKRDASPSENSGKIMSIIRRTARRLSGSNSTSSLSSSSPPSSTKDVNKTTDFKLYVARIDPRRQKAFQTQVPFIINNNTDDDDNDDPNWRQYKASQNKESSSSLSSLSLQDACKGSGEASELEQLKEAIENLKSELLSLEQKVEIKNEEKVLSNNLVDTSLNDTLVNTSLNDDSNTRRLSVKEIKTIFENKTKS